MTVTRILLVIAIAIGATLIWLSDNITPQGERTVYTVKCTDGAWEGPHCPGRLAPAERFRFRALKAHAEVLFWTIGATGEPSGKFSDCVIEDGRSWRCKDSVGLSRTITREMQQGAPVPDKSGLALKVHVVPKWRWMMLSWGLPGGHDAIPLQ